MTQATVTRRRGGPLAMLIMLVGVWGTGRAMLWESPFPLEAFDLPVAELLFAEGPSDPEGRLASVQEPNEAAAIHAFERALVSNSQDIATFSGTGHPASSTSAFAFGTSPVIAAGHSFLMAAAFQIDWSQGAPGFSEVLLLEQDSNSVFANQVASPTGVNRLAPPLDALGEDVDRWSLDAFAFYRAGSGSTSISQGRVPVYGASQVGANLQYRAAPGSRHDPRAFLRAYRAFVPDGETEVAGGVSARPIGAVPMRLAAELRVTDNTFKTELRPAVYAVTELPVAHLPFHLRAEAYAGAGFVSGNADTAFVDGQAAVTREIVSLDGLNNQPMRFSLGGGAWGGAQRDASRLDVGPSMRVDLTIGDVPARISIDWRERVAGDAAPNSGVAATLSTRF